MYPVLEILALSDPFPCSFPMYRSQALPITELPVLTPPSSGRREDQGAKLVKERLGKRKGKSKTTIGQIWCYSPLGPRWWNIISSFRFLNPRTQWEVWWCTIINWLRWPDVTWASEGNQREKGGVRTDFIQTKYYDWPSSFETGSFSGAQGLMIQKLCFFIYCNITHPLECFPTLFTSDLPNTLNVSSARDPCSFRSVPSFFPILPSPYPSWWCSIIRKGRSWGGSEHGNGPEHPC